MSAEATPLYDGLIISRGFDPQALGPEPIGPWREWGPWYDNAAYTVDLTDPRLHTQPLERMLALLTPTQAWAVLTPSGA